ncbi:MAG: alpha-N-acetylgalactosaminidase [Pseudoalteromonas sp.]|uniref:Gfo/Idh/MocA family protein n=1 Tax=Pseudoalteromonas sp. TaxID=53249 RepID=UPI000C944FA9|nr:Gfo/Idh/MocA family oxidoreductase [Pseudoalteromonas sp.]MAD03291.1 alpha-N-acetylgalactosaminidase [Pseudoalteromonas sp.]|tara:strand:+ start:21961 stop:23421 length:1461 start_codon:yes stop_codon:yes gene_type:complete
MTIDRRSFLKSAAAITAATVVTGCAKSQQGDNQSTPLAAQGKSVMGLAVPAMDVVRVGFIGVGQRGSGHVKHLCHIEGVEIKAICDTDQLMLDKSVNYVVEKGLPKPTAYTGSDKAYLDMLARDDIDIVIISTPWKWHTPMSVETMESGKHAFVEVPAATTMEECWQLVNTAERTQKNCMMMENVNYGRDELMVLNMVRKGVFGELLHGEAAYIHDLRWQMKEIDRSTGSWRTYWHTKVNGNLYPTHGLGPVSQYMNINRGDRFDFVTSVSSPALGRAAYAERKFPAGHERRSLKFTAGDMNTSIIKTVKGRSIMVQHDTTSPRPYSRHNLIQGTNGTFAGFPNRIALEDVPPAIAKIYQQQYEAELAAWEKAGSQGRKPHMQNFHSWDQDMEKWRAEFDHPLWKRMGEEAVRNGGHGGMDFIMLWRMIYCLRNNEPLDQDVYDAAAWSSIFPQSMASVADRSNSKTIPDFTRGAWQTGKPLGIVS